MRILVTGAQGYLGAKVVDRLAARGAIPIPAGRRSGIDVLQCDLTDPDDVSRALGAVSIDRIVHCAAFVPKTITGYNDLGNNEKNLCMTKNLLAATSCPFVYISSMTVYGTGGTVPKREESAGNPTSAYGMVKWQGEKCVEASDRPALAIRIPGLFGAPRKGGLVENLIYALRDGRSPSLPENPLLWAAMHVDDAAESIATLALANFQGFYPVNVGYREVYSISRLVTIASQLYSSPVNYDVDHPDFQFHLKRAGFFGAVPNRTLLEALKLLRVTHE